MPYTCDRHMKTKGQTAIARYLITDADGRGLEAACHIHLQPALNSRVTGEESVEVKVTVLPRQS